MIVKILGSSATFAGVRYNTDKLKDGKGELMKVSGFGPLQLFSALRPTDYINYLKAISAGNKRISKPQFHAVISAQGKSTDKIELTAIAGKWLERMGYGKNPYLIVFHKDTENNHVHVVSTRVDRSGRKINAAFEKIRAVHCLNQIMGLDEKAIAVKDADECIKYQFSTMAQFKLLLELKGYTITQNESLLCLVKNGKSLAEVDVNLVEKGLGANHNNLARIKQLHQLFIKYLKIYDGSLLSDGIEDVHKSHLGSPTSAFSRYMKEKFGVELIFHSKDRKLPYGYTVIDHANKNVFKGSEVFPIREMLSFNLKPVSPNSRSEAPLPKPLNPYFNYGQSTFIDDDEFSITEQILGAKIEINLADDVDDEAVLGRNRQRKRKSTTSTR